MSTTRFSLLKLGDNFNRVIKFNRESDHNIAQRSQSWRR